MTNYAYAVGIFFFFLAFSYFLLLWNYPLFWSSHSMEEIVMMNFYGSEFNPFSNWYGHLALLKIFYQSIHSFADNPGLAAFIARQVFYFILSTTLFFLLLGKLKINRSFRFLFVLILWVLPGIQHQVLAAENNLALFPFLILFLTMLFFRELSLKHYIGIGVGFGIMMIHHSLGKIVIFSLFFIPVYILQKNITFLKNHLIMILSSLVIVLLFQIPFHFSFSILSVFENNFITPVVSLPTPHSWDFWKNYLFIGFHKNLWAGIEGDLVWLRYGLKAISLSLLLGIFWRCYLYLIRMVQNRNDFFESFLYQLTFLSLGIALFYRPPYLEYWGPFFLLFLICLIRDYQTSLLSRTLLASFIIIGLLSFKGRIHSLEGGEVPLSQSKLQNFHQLHRQLKSLQKPQGPILIQTTLENAPYEGLIRVYFPNAKRIIFTSKTGKLWQSSNCPREQNWCSILPPSITEGFEQYLEVYREKEEIPLLKI